MKINENIKNFRTFRGIKQQQLADALGRSKSVISNWERGANSPDLESCEKMCRIFSVTPNELFGWEENAEYTEWLKNTKQLEIELHNMEQAKEDMERRIMEYKKRLETIRKDS